MVQVKDKKLKKTPMGGPPAQPAIGIPPPLERPATSTAGYIYTLSTNYQNINTGILDCTATCTNLSILQMHQ